MNGLRFIITYVGDETKRAVKWLKSRGLRFKVVKQHVHKLQGCKEFRDFVVIWYVGNNIDQMSLTMFLQGSELF